MLYPDQLAAGIVTTCSAGKHARATGWCMSDKIAARLRELGLELPAAPAPVANYVPYLISGDHLYVSGQISKAADGTLIAGRVGDTASVETGIEAAKACALNILAQAQAALGSLDRVTQLVRLTGFVSSGPDFTDHPKVINGASDLMVAVLGDKGRHTRAAVGVSSLPVGAAVEIDAIFSVM